MNPTTTLRAVGLGVAALALACSVAIPATAKPAPATQDGPKNIIVMIGDGMGYTHVDLASLYLSGRAANEIAVDAETGEIDDVAGKGALAFESFPVRVGMSTWSLGQQVDGDEGGYDPLAAWANFDYFSLGDTDGDGVADQDPSTDSAAAATAMASGVKTYDAAIGVDNDGVDVELVTERAIDLGKAAGVVSSVEYSHATPAGYSAHEASRNNYLEIANDQVNSELSVVMGAGHPCYDDDAESKACNYKYISEDDYETLKDGESWTLVESTDEFSALTTGETPDRVFGIARVATTLQQNRSGDRASVAPFVDEFNDVPSLATMTLGALNVLDNDEDGLFLMVEGGAIDWAGHANQTGRDIEETLAFDEAVYAAIDWVEANSSWQDTLLIVTADHETGYLYGAGSGADLTAGDPDWMPMSSYTDAQWNSGDHTNQLVPLYAVGAGAKELRDAATMTDPVRGVYLDNTVLGTLVLEQFWNPEFAGPGASEYANGAKNGKNK